MGGGFHVDFLLLTLRGVVVIDLRDVKGNIFGGDQMAEWTVMDGAQRFTFTNPQGALYDRIAAVKAITGDAPVEGRIVFTRRGKFPKGLPKWTLMVDALRPEFSAADFEAPAEGAAQYREGWQRLKDAVKPSYMVDMR
jgi:Nuclease-related domain